MDPSGAPAMATQGLINPVHDNQADWLEDDDPSGAPAMAPQGLINPVHDNQADWLEDDEAYFVRIIMPGEGFDTFKDFSTTLCKEDRILHVHVYQKINPNVPDISSENFIARRFLKDFQYGINLPETVGPFSTSDENVFIERYLLTVKLPKVRNSSEAA